MVCLPGAAAIILRVSRSLDEGNLISTLILQAAVVVLMTIVKEIGSRTIQLAGIRVKAVTFLRHRYGHYID